MIVTTEVLHPSDSTLDAIQQRQANEWRARSQWLLYDPMRQLHTHQRRLGVKKFNFYSPAMYAIKFSLRYVCIVKLLLK